MALSEREELEQTLKAARELLRLEEARQEFLPFCQFTSPDTAGGSLFKIAQHHKVIAEALEKVDRGDIEFLAISMPPRHGKSEMVTRKFPAWFAARHPRSKIIIAGYSAEFAEREFGLPIQQLLDSDEYKRLFPGLYSSMASKGVTNLVFGDGTGITSTGVGGAINGRGADVFIVDDPIKDDEESSSALIRNKLWRWFTSTVMYRMMREGRVIVVMSRWNEDDILGRIFDPTNPEYNEKFAKQWTYLKVPGEILTNEMSDALQIPKGNYLWEEHFGREYYDLRKSVSKRDWSALMMQEPAPESGTYYHRDMINLYQRHELPPKEKLRMYSCSDHAVSTDKDFQCMGAWGVDEHNHIWIMPELYWEQDDDTNNVVDEMLAIMVMHKPTFWWAESGHISKSILPFLRTRMREQNVYVAVDDSLRPSTDIRIRSRSIQGRFGMRMVHMPAFAPWCGRAIDEMMKMPYGSHDDFCAFLALIGMALDREIPAAGSREPEKVLRVGSIEWVKKSAAARLASEKRRKAHGGF